jgi:hypothetical protein
LYIAWAAGGGGVAAGTVGSSGKDLWRVVGNTELNELGGNGGIFVPSPTGSESKYFWGSVESAQAFVGKLPENWLIGGGATIVKTQISDASLIEGPNHMDGLPDAYNVSNELFHLLGPASRQ